MSKETKNYREIFEQEWDKYQAKHELYPNIMILGRTGVGKSSLINRIFGSDIAPVSDIRPQTQEFDEYKGKDHGIFVNFIDSKGYEINDDAPMAEAAMTAFMNKVKKEISDRRQKEDSQIHIIWYCISVAEHKIEPIDIELIKQLSSIEYTKKRLSVVLSKCDQDDENGSKATAIKTVIKEEIKSTVPIFEVSTDPKLPLELNDLIVWSKEALGDSDLRDNFVASQMINLNEKKKLAEKYINVAATAAAAIGGAPIPGGISDAALLTPVQMTMIVGIINAYNLKSLANISKQVVSDIVISNLGKSIAGGLIKLIPVAGQIAGGIINATVAASITKALGEACSYICYTACKNIMEGKNVDFENLFDVELLMQIFKEMMKKEENNG